MKEYTYSDYFMGTELDIAVLGMENPELDFLMIKSLFKRYEDTFSRFKKSSEVSRLNENKELVVSREFVEVFLLAREVYLFTDRLINPLCTPKYFGYESNFDDLDKQKLKKTNFGNTEFEQIFIDLEASKIILKSEQNLDFGGLLKGYITQLACNYLSKHEGVIVNLGGDIFTRGYDLDKNRFVFELANPLDVDKSLGTIKLFNQALTTSSTIKRNWLVDGEKFTHIIDPRNNKSVQNDILSVTVIHDQGIYADALAKVGLILGLEEGIKYYERKQIPAVFVLNDLNLVLTKSMKKYFNF